jgi:hypothetical protein
VRTLQAQIPQLDLPRVQVSQLMMMLDDDPFIVLTETKLASAIKFLRYENKNLKV